MPSPPVDSRETGITPEEIAAIVVGTIAFIGEVLLPVITFWWRFTFSLGFVILAVDLCLRSRRIQLRSISRLLLSVGAVIVIVAMLWNPLRKQYMQEHLPPSLVFIVGAPLGDYNSPVWVVFTRHYGPESVHHCDVSFWDLDRKNIEYNWRAEHHSSFSPPGIAGGDSQANLVIPELGAQSGAIFFAWTPLDANHQHYSIVSNCREGQVEEHWNVARINGILSTEINVTLVPQNQALNRVVLACADPQFSNVPLATAVPNISHRPINPGWKPNIHDFPVAIINANGNLMVASPSSGRSLGCWDVIRQHLGDAQLPLTLSTSNQTSIVEIAVLVFGILVLAVPLFCLFAFWRMGIPIVR